MNKVERVNLTLPVGLQERAHNHGINVSRVSANAILRIVEAIEKETGANLPGPTPDTSSQGVAQ